jgi:lysophospholipase L1-like esterase
VNTALTAGVAAHRRTAVLVDWNAVASRRPGLLWDDRIHPRPAGGQLYAQALADALTAARSAFGAPGASGGS